MLKQDLTYYLCIGLFMVFFLNPTNLTYKHIHLTTALILSYLILFPSKYPKLRNYLYDMRGLLLIYFVLVFKVDPTISLLLYIVTIMIINQHDYEHDNKKTKNINIEEFNGVDNFTYDNRQYQPDSEYKHNNQGDICNARKHITDEQLDKISDNNLENSVKEIVTYRDGYSAQGTNFTLGHNYDSYGDLYKSNMD
jgi:hypothetical protein